jgi:cell wall-associated NlpC family hydrolase
VNPQKNLLDRYVLIIGISYLALLLITSIWINKNGKSAGLSKPDSKEILSYAQSFLKDSSNASLGKKTDCSGFTKLVFTHFRINPGVSAIEQFRKSERLNRYEINPGNLVFFNTNGNNISHVGICVDSLTFIHSPGLNKYVRIDSITNLYWSKNFICGGKVGFKN